MQYQRMLRLSALLTSTAGACMTALVPTLAADFSFEGELTFEARSFLNAPASLHAKRNYGSVSTLLELGIYDDANTHAFIFKGFARGDSEDDNRSHADLREAKYIFVSDNYELAVGIDHVFWGVTEFAHIVDIINQNDATESVDGEQKLGQPMLRSSYVSEYGTFSGFYMPLHRPRTVFDKQGRPASGLIISDDHELYESNHANEQNEFALRYENSFDAFDIGLAYFDGTAREPIINPANSVGGEITPYYPLLKQISLDTQATLGPWLLKLEALQQDQLDEQTARAVIGFEYTFYGLLGTSSDLGLVAEYMWDERQEIAPHPLANDIAIGFRWTANDVQSTTLLAGAIIDLDHQSMGVSLEAERRLTNNLSLSVEARFQTNIDPADQILSSIKDEDFIRLQLTTYF